MSQLGHELPNSDVRVASAYPPIADMLLPRVNAEMGQEATSPMQGVSGTGQFLAGSCVNMRCGEGRHHVGDPETRGDSGIRCGRI
jgi:hypothetical protein